MDVQATQARGLIGQRPACLVAGCPCKDARIVSHRRAAFYAAWAREHGETADRIVDADPAWSTSSSAPLAGPTLSAASPTA
jgi:hypothetical protein